MKTRMSMVNTGFGILLLVILAILLINHASAVPEYLPKLQNVYGNGSCETCHFNSNGEGDLTGYGNKFADQTGHFKDPELAIRTIGEPPFKVPIKMSEYVLALQGKYGNGSCLTCHINKNGGNLTKYGERFSVQSDHKDDPVMAVDIIGYPDGVSGITTTEKTEKTENADKKSPGFEIIMAIGIVSMIYISRRYKLQRR